MAENFQNFYVTKLREACDASATTIYVDTPPNFSEGTLVLEFSNSTKHEIIHFTGKSGYGLTGCTRGHEGTTAQSHSAGVDVRQNVTAGILDKIINRAITTENIADNAVTTAKINNGAVTADKIDWTTISDISFQTGTGGRKNIPANSSVSLLSYTVPSDGLYLIYAETQVEFYSNLIRLSISVNNVNKISSNQNMISQADFYMSFGTFLPYRLNTGDVVSMSLTTGNKDMSYFGNETKLICVKIGG